jgi:hypothetical protein
VARKELKTFIGEISITTEHSPVGLEAQNWSRVPTANENSGQMQKTRTEDEGPITAPFCVGNGRNGVSVADGALKYKQIN